MISSEVQRTLVKSPPELWAELSDPTSLARHLGELGEIRITRVEPERTVEWEAADATGKVLLKASGWGTKVTLTVAREVAGPEAVAEPEPVIESEAASETSAGNEPEPRPTAGPELANVVETEIEPVAEVATVEPQPEPTATAEPEHETLIEEPVKRPGFFARLFGRRPKAQALERPVEPAAIAEPASPAEPQLTVEPEPVEEPEQEPTANSQPDAEHETLAENVLDIAAELLAAEEAATAEVTAVLTAVLDRLGAAHHRPFSRA